MTVVLPPKMTPNEVGIQELDGVLYPFSGCCGARVVRLGTQDDGFTGWCDKCSGRVYGNYDHVSLTVESYAEDELKLVVGKWTGLLKRQFTLHVL